MDIGNIISLILFCICIVCLIFKYYTNLQKNKANEQMKRLFDNLKDVIEDTMIDYLQNVDINNITNISSMQKEVLEGLYDKVWDLVMNEIADLYIKDESLANTIKPLLTRKTIEDMVDKIFIQSPVIQEQITSKYNNAVLSAHK